jgi:sulfate permease, SulP family
MAATCPTGPSREGLVVTRARLAPAWLTHYARDSWRLDVVAGLTVTALLVPEGMAYAQLAGVPPQAAFYAAPAALLLYAFLGSSRQLVVAVSSAIAITSAATISELAPQGSAEYVTLTAALALLAGLVSIVAGLLRLGRIARLFSSSVLLGFVFGLALIITVKQIPKLLGVELTEEEFFRQVAQIVHELPETSLVTLAVGLACLAAMVLLQRFMPRLPAALAVLLGSIVVSAALDLSERGVAVVGPLPSGLAPPQLPGVGWEAVPLLAAGAMGIALLAFAEAMGPAQQLAKKHGYEVDANRELIAIGASNTGAGLFQGFPIGASLSKSAANDRAGARSPMSLVVAAAATALVALFLTPLFQELPEAALGAIVIVAVSEMERIAPLRRLWRIRRADLVVALIALLGVLVVGILPGLALAVLVSLGLIVWRAGEGHLEILGDRRPPEDSGEPRRAGSLLVVRPLQMLFFANADEIREAVTAAVGSAGARPDVVVLDLGLTPDLDVPSLDVLLSLRETLGAAGTQLWLVTRIDRVLERLDLAGVRDPARGEVFRDVTGALLGYVALHSASGDRGRTAVLSDVLAVVRERRDDPATDESARVVLDQIEQRLLRDIDGD